MVVKIRFSNCKCTNVTSDVFMYTHHMNIFMCSTALNQWEVQCSSFAHAFAYELNIL